MHWIIAYDSLCIKRQTQSGAILAAMHHKGSLINYNHTKNSACAGIIYPVCCDELLISNLMQT